MDLNAVQRFFRECHDSLMRIVRASRGELELGDVQNTAYELALEIQARQGAPFDFDAEAHRAQLLKWTAARLVKFADKHLRRAVSLDEDPEEERPTQASINARRVRAHESSDPAVAMRRAESEREAEEAVRAHYSELVAYLLLFRKHDTRKALALFLRITSWTLTYRLHRAEERSGHASLFDGIEHIDPDFPPTIARGKAASFQGGVTGEQQEWAF